MRKTSPLHSGLPMMMMVAWMVPSAELICQWSYSRRLLP
jgi:hypothetical protein